MSWKDNSSYSPRWVLAVTGLLATLFGLFWGLRLLEFLEEKLSGSVHQSSSVGTGPDPKFGGSM